MMEAVLEEDRLLCTEDHSLPFESCKRSEDADGDAGRDIDVETAAADLGAAVWVEAVMAAAPYAALMAAKSGSVAHAAQVQAAGIAAINPNPMAAGLAVPIMPAAGSEDGSPHTSAATQAGSDSVAPPAASAPATPAAAAPTAAGATPATARLLPASYSPPDASLPVFIQTSAVVPNVCGYCRTRTTSGCWRRGWELTPGSGRYLNLCNKCGLRYKAGKLDQLPPTLPLASSTSAGAGAAPAAPQRAARYAPASARGAGGASSVSGGGGGGAAAATVGGGGSSVVLAPLAPAPALARRGGVKTDDAAHLGRADADAQAQVASALASMALAAGRIGAGGSLQLQALVAHGQDAGGEGDVDGGTMVGVAHLPLGGGGDAAAVAAAEAAAGAAAAAAAAAAAGAANSEANQPGSARGEAADAAAGDEDDAALSPLSPLQSGRRRRSKRPSGAALGDDAAADALLALNSGDGVDVIPAAGSGPAALLLGGSPEAAAALINQRRTKQPKVSSSPVAACASPALPAATALRVNPTCWTRMQVQGWLTGVGCGAAAGAFREQDMDGRALAGLMRLSGFQPACLERLLREELGLSCLGLRLRVMEALLLLFGTRPLL